jgi:cytochrome P450
MSLLARCNKRAVANFGLFASSDVRADRKRIEYTTLLGRTTLDIIGAAGSSLEIQLISGFGYEFNSIGDSDSPLAKAYETIFNEEMKPKGSPSWLPMLSFPWILRVALAQRTIVRYARKLVRDKLERQDHTPGKDILSCLIENRLAPGKWTEMDIVNK